MNYCLMIINIVLFILLAFLVLKIKNANKEQTPAGLLIGTGLALITSSFPDFTDKLFNFAETALSYINSVNTTQTNEMDVNIISLICGILLVLLGIYYNLNIKDRFFVLNILSKDRRLITERNNIKDLKIIDFKLREHQIDVVRMFDNANKITVNSCKYIFEEIEEKTKRFISESNDFKKAFTGMFSIPFTILAGTYLSATEIDKYFEYNRNTCKYYSLKEDKWYKKIKTYPKLTIETQSNNIQSKEIVVAVSITKNITDGDLIQFTGKDILKIGLQNPKDNVIEFREQLGDYAKLIVDTIENLKTTYPNLETVHLVGAIPSCLSIELGRKISLISNRLPMIISYHFKFGNIPKYNFGIIVTEKDKGKLIKP